MVKTLPRAVVSVSILMWIAGCASTPAVDREQARTLIGQENGVRVNAQIFGESFSVSSVMRIAYEVENGRERPIAIADLVADTSYDSETQTVTVAFGSEVPGNSFIPKLIPIAPGETKTFSTKAKLDFLIANQILSMPRYIRIKLSYLDDVHEFATLLDIPEKAVHDPKLANNLFPRWIEHNQTVITNSVPIRWRMRETDDQRTRTRRMP